MGRRRCRFVPRPWLLFSAVVGAVVLPAGVAQADAAWSGASTSPSWSDPANWSGGTVPSSSTGTLSFPALGSCGTCYVSRNDLSGVKAAGVVFGNTTNQYSITGNSLIVGRRGITDTPGGGAGDVIQAPIVLARAQSWVVGSQLGGYNSLTLQGGVSGGAADAISMSMPKGDLFVDSDMEVGPVTSAGPGGLHVGGAPGTGQPGSINGSDGQPVAVTGGSLVANPGSTTGPLSLSGSSLLLLGTNPNNNGTTTLAVEGAATLGPSTVTSSFIDDNGSSPGTDFSQLSATGDIILGGALVLGQGLSNNTGPCVVLTPGDVATLVTTQGTLSGTFANAPDGAMLTMRSSCESVPPTLRINYTPNSVTATVIDSTGTPAVTTTPPTPSPAMTTPATTTPVTPSPAPKGTTTTRPPRRRSRTGPAAVTLRRVAQAHARWREPGSHRAGSRARHRGVPVGTHFTFRVSGPGRIRFTFVQLLPGRRVGRRCLAPTRARSRDHACTRTRTRGRLVRFVRSGTHRVRFVGRIGRSRLPAGRYALEVTATGRHGTRSRTTTLHFTIVG